MVKTFLKVVSVPLLFLLVGACATSPEPEVPESEESPPEAELSERESEEVSSLRQEVRTLRRELQQTQAELAEARKPMEEGEPAEEELRQLERENERLKNLVEELRLALIAAEGIEALSGDLPPQEPGTRRQAQAEELDTPEPEEPQVASAERYSFRQVDGVNPPLASRTPPQLAAQGVERVPLESGGYRYVDGSANKSSGEGIYLELELLPGMELPEIALMAKSVYPAEAPRLLLQRVTFGMAGQSFELVPQRVERLRDGQLLAETARFPLSPEVRRLLTLIQRRPGAELTVTFQGVNGERTHQVTRRERLALANMIYTFREMGGSL